MKINHKKLSAMIMTLVMIVTCLVSPAMASPAEAHTNEVPQESTMLPAMYETVDGEIVEVSAEKDTTEKKIMVTVEDGSTVFLQTGNLDLAVAHSQEQQADLYAAHSAIESALDMNVDVEHYFSLVFNGFSFTGESWMIDAINEIDGLSATEAIMFELIEPDAVDETINLTPQMASATGMVGATNVWDLGYTGKGMAVGIIDTGIKQTHEAFSVEPEGAKITREYLADVFAMYGDKLHGENPDGAYYSAKMPYNWDYFDDDHIPNHTASNHGSHVAGIAAGNNGDDFKGVAPDAQIVSLQVFTDTGGAYVDDMLAAMEDAVYLGLDAINMSLGISNGFETYSWPIDFAPVYEAMERAGVAVCVAASNDAHAYLSTSYGYWEYNMFQWLSSNPDNGLIGTPGTYVGSFTVGNTKSVSRKATPACFFAGRIIDAKASANPSAPKLSTLPAGEYTLVNCGAGTAQDFAAVGDLTGKIALALRPMYGGSKAICTAAAEAGAAGILIYNHTPNVAVPNEFASANIPFAHISNEDGLAMIAAMGEGNTTTIVLDVEYTYASPITMSGSSSWGPTAQLSLKPDISAPGHEITSVDGTDSAAKDAYTKKTGTSMATPAVAGGILLLKQHLKTVFPNATATELTELAYAFMMSTAGHADAFIRRQGAGVMDLEKATKARAYLTTTENTRPKLELDDSENGEFAIAFQIHNAGSADKTYDIGFTAMTENTFTMEYEGYHSFRKQKSPWYNGEIGKRWDFWLVNPQPETVTLCNGTVKNVTDWCTLEGEKTVTVKAGETLTVNLTLKAGEELMKYFRDNCPSGMYLEGWVNLTDTTSANRADLSIPYLGFVGDWDYPAMIDEGWWWQIPYGENNLSQFYNSNAKGGIFLGYGDAEQGLGLNYYWDSTNETYVADRNAISPNGDGYLDALTTVEFSLLRQPRRVNSYIRYADGSEISLYDKSYSFTRETHPYGAAFGGEALTYSYMYFDYDLSNMAENETATFVVETYLDHDEFQIEDNKLAKLEIPFTKDTVAPIVTAVDGGVEIQDSNYVAYYAIYADARCTNLVFEDGVFATERGVKETYKTDMDEYFVSVADYARNEAFYYIKDGQAYALDAEGFDHGRTIVGQRHRVINKTTESTPAFAWYAFSEHMDQIPQQLTEISAESDDVLGNITYSSDIIGIGKTADGKIYASSMGFLYSVDPVTFERTKIAKYQPTLKDTVALYAFGVAPGTNNLYGVVQHGPLHDLVVEICSIDPEDGTFTKLWDYPEGNYRKAWAFYDADTVMLLRNTSPRAFELYNINDGTLEKTIDLGLSYSDGVFGKNPIGGFYGYVQSMLYDDENNCVYLGGDYSFSRLDRSYEHIIQKIDLTTGQIEIMTTGYNGGVGLYSLMFLEDLTTVEEPEHVCYIKETVEATCEEGGYYLKVCAECGEEFKAYNTEPLGHNYNAVVVPPTCTTDGYTIYTCVVCGHSYDGDIISAKGHDYEAVVTEPTCTTLGYTTYTCKVCGSTYTGDFKPTTDHQYGEWQTVTAPTCNTKGQEKRICECGAVEYRDTDITGHNYETVVTDPTCAELGYTTYTCKVCGDSYKSDFVAPSGHAYESVVTEPTCTTLGYTTHTCSVCGDSYKDNYTPATGHIYGEWETVTAPTCTAEGQEKRICVCGAAEYRDTDKAEHQYKAVVTAPTCTDLGYTTHTCVACGDSYKDDFKPAVGHTYGEWQTMKEATCTEKGVERRTCVCGAAEYRDADKAEHQYRTEVTAPTCTEIGYTTYTCTYCGDSYKTDYVAPTGHSFGDWVLTRAATCTGKGEETRTCACGETETRNIDKTEHQYETVVTAPTCTEIGYTTYTCAVCGHNYIADLQLATGHDHVAIVTEPTCTEEGYTTYTCHCGDSYVGDEVPAVGHTFGEWAETRIPACAEPGEEVRTCEVCGATESRETESFCPAKAFSDVDTRQWYHDGLCYVLRNGLMVGKSESVFAPNADLSRAELVTILYRMAGSPSVENMTQPFTDVMAGQWYSNAVIWAYNAEVVKGISNTAFAPNANITREQIAAILYRYAGAEAVEEDSLKDFTDAGKVNAYAVEAMNWAVSVGLINGVAEGELAPQSNATRAQIATILMRYCEG